VGGVMPGGGAAASASGPAGGSGSAHLTKDEMKTALHILLPVKSWLHNPGWRQRLRLAVIPYGLLPMAFIAYYQNSTNFNTPGWVYSLYIAPLWAFVFWLLIRPGPLNK